MWITIERDPVCRCRIGCRRRLSCGQSPAYRAPRADGGKPDLNGIWQALNEANYDLERTWRGRRWRSGPAPTGRCRRRRCSRSARSARCRPASGVVEGGEIPYKPEALAKKKENQENWLTRDPEIKCYLPGRAARDLHAVSVSDFPEREPDLHRLRIRRRRAQHLPEGSGPAPVDSWMGQSVGRWEGDTLVVDVTGFNDQTWFDRAGNFHSDALHVVERYTRTSPDVITYEATIEDPKMFTRPWKISMPLYRRLEKNAQLMDFKCVEFVEELMYGQWRKKPLAGNRRRYVTCDI